MNIASPATSGTVTAPPSTNSASVSSADPLCASVRKTAHKAQAEHSERPPALRRFTEAQIAALRNNPPVICTEPELAIVLQRSERSLRDDRRARRLPFIRHGGAVRYRTGEVLRALERLEIRSV